MGQRYTRGAVYAANTGRPSSATRHVQSGERAGRLLAGEFHDTF